MVVLWVMSGLEIGGPLVVLSPFHWTIDHIPLVGIYDWGGLALVGVRRRRVPRRSGSSCSTAATWASPPACRLPQLPG